MRSVITAFAGNLEEALPRYACRFVPYATNVNAGHLLENQWVANTWQYQSRKQDGSETTGHRTYSRTGLVSGSRSDWQVESTYDATYYPAVQTRQPVARMRGTVPTRPSAGSAVTACELFHKTDTLPRQSSEPFAGHCRNARDR